MSTINDVCIERFVSDFFSRDRTYESMLDLGCGIQPYAKYYQPKASFCIPADYTARSTIAVRLSATALPFKAATFDVVLFSEVLEHLADPQLALVEIARVLKPGGKLILTTPFLYMMHEIPFDHFRFTSFGLVGLLGRAGLNVDDVRHRGTVIAVAVAVGEFLVRGASEAIARVPQIGPVWRRMAGKIGSAWRFVIKRSYGRARHRSLPAEELLGHYRGARGQMRLWSLGYCIEATKPLLP